MNNCWVCTVGKRKGVKDLLSVWCDKWHVLCNTNDGCSLKGQGNSQHRVWPLFYSVLHTEFRINSPVRRNLPLEVLSLCFILNELFYFKFFSGIFIFVIWVFFVWGLWFLWVFLVAGGGEEKGTFFKNIWKISKAKQRGDAFFFEALRLVMLLSVLEKVLI